MPTVQPADSIAIEYTSIGILGNIYLPAVAIVGTITPPTIKIRPISSIVPRWQNIFFRSKNRAKPWTPAERARKTDADTMLKHLPTHYDIDFMADLLMRIACWVLGLDFDQ